MSRIRHVGMDVHKEAIAIAVMNSTGKLGRLLHWNSPACMIAQKPSRLRDGVVTTPTAA
jgi:hypothetical protein